MRALLYASWLQHWTVQHPMDLLGSFAGTVALVAEALTHGSRCGHCRAPTGVLQLLRERVISKLRVAEEGWWGNLHQAQSTQQMHLHVSGGCLHCMVPRSLSSTRSYLEVCQCGCPKRVLRAGRKYDLGRAHTHGDANLRAGASMHATAAL